VLPKNLLEDSSRQQEQQQGKGKGKGKGTEDKFVASLMVYDLLFGRGIQCGGPLKAALQTHKAKLKEELVKVKAREKAASDEDLIPERVRNAVVIPRFVRVNTLLITIEGAIKTFKEQGFIFQQPSVDKVVPEGTEFWQDRHLEEVLLFAPNADFHLNELYTSGKVVLQDKASCFPAAVLRPRLHSKVIDACAAPGNKTSHLAALMKNTGEITAFDISPRRLNLLIKLTGKVGATNIKGWCCILSVLFPARLTWPSLSAVNSSFLDAAPMDPQFAEVEYILLDPSCSGSGIVGRLDELVDPLNSASATPGETEASRLESLAEFQLSVINHAMKFPGVKKVVYSTCSIHAQENEEVVTAALKENPGFHLTEALPKWPRRGLPHFSGAENMVRTLPKEDNLIGFFVACFERGAAPGVDLTGAAKLPKDSLASKKGQGNADLLSGGGKEEDKKSSLSAEEVLKKQRKNQQKKAKARVRASKARASKAKAVALAETGDLD